MKRFVVLAVVALAIGCGSDSPMAPTPTPTPTPTPNPSPPVQVATFSEVQSQVFDASCVVHHGSTASAGLDLRSPQSFANLVNVVSPASGIAFVVPGDADGSYLVQKLEGAAGIIGDQMPRTNQQISADLIQLVRDWIDDGALDN